MTIVYIADMISWKYHLLDANTTSNEDHILNIINIDSSGRPGEASANSDAQLLAENLFFWSPQPCGGWVIRRVLYSQLYIWWSPLRF